jgi:hypothetical protein
MSSHISTVQAHLIENTPEQGAPEKVVTKSSGKPEVDLNNPLHPLHISNRDLRITPSDWTPADADPNDVLSHYDLRLKVVPSLQ